MRSGPIALRAAGAALVLVLAPTAGSAYAHDGVKVTVTPSTASPGADVDVRVQGCKGTTGAAKSPAFVADAELTGRDGGGAPLFGDTTIKTRLENGTYKVSVTCDGHDHPDVGTVRVERQKPTHEPTRKPTHEPTHKPTHEPTHEPTHHASPVAPVRAGGGGTAAFAAPAAPGVAQTTSESGLGTPYTLLGLGLAAVAAVAVAFRSSRRRDAGTGTGSGSGTE
ncbi:PT domain-containing protein [Streptomyces sp. NBC_00233]|uniref:PT domain-containing protein n=1 Tax=Streptomyces sp. NBC_00233 TaxID=2975686 RepID=UPI002253C1D8|nr:PT domain-containing protein [Streptomyces sp. NBC_00233]MCX5226412.1 PT domain-containing protein [Streptomyces sp. NBC_00233]